MLPQIVAHLNSSGADVLADAIEVALETGADEVGMDDKDQPDLRSAVETWAATQQDVPAWASAVIGH